MADPVAINLGSVVGPPGAKGDPGEQGIPGEQGAQGDPGKDGKDGKNGNRFFVDVMEPTDPAKDDIWFNTIANTLSKWNGSVWLLEATLPTGVTLDDAVTELSGNGVRSSGIWKAYSKEEVSTGNGIGAYAGVSYECAKRGGMCMTKVSYHGAQIPVSNVARTFVTLPEGYRPRSDLVVIASINAAKASDAAQYLGSFCLSAQTGDVLLTAIIGSGTLTTTGVITGIELVATYMV